MLYMLTRLGFRPETASLAERTRDVKYCFVLTRGVAILERARHSCLLGNNSLSVWRKGQLLRRLRPEADSFKGGEYRVANSIALHVHKFLVLATEGHPVSNYSSLANELRPHLEQSLNTTQTCCVT
jgi:hypothetical protein